MREVQTVAIVHNMPEEHEQYIVARIFEGELWFWGSWKDKEDAESAARKIDGVVVEEMNVKITMEREKYGRRSGWNNQS